jgi:hypothetical protein
MRLELIIPLLALAFAVVGLAIVIALLGQRKRLEERVLASLPRGPVVARTATLSGPDVRIRTAEESDWRGLKRLLNIPIDLPLAHVVSPGLVLTAATALAVLTSYGSHFLVSWWASLLDALVLWILLTRGIFGGSCRIRSTWSSARPARACRSPKRSGWWCRKCPTPRGPSSPASPMRWPWACRRTTRC